VDEEVERRLDEHYARVNRHNEKALAGRKPPPLAPGEKGWVGVAECSTCHAEEEKFWRGTPHARAYATLEKDHKEFNLDCVGCHISGYEKPGGSTVTHVAALKDVQCETCHGPGGKHVESEKAADVRRVPAKEACAAECHHPPHVGPDWSVERAWKEIIGPGHGQD
jgi:hypothetical protein